MHDFLVSNVEGLTQHPLARLPVKSSANSSKTVSLTELLIRQVL